MTPEQIEQERTAFEAWVKGSKEGGLPVSLRKDKEKSYFNPLAEVSFMAWLARAEQSSWINVNDRLPQLREDVLVAWSNGEIGFARRFNPQNSGECWDITASNATITHWQSLPALPTTNPAM